MSLMRDESWDDAPAALRHLWATRHADDPTVPAFFAKVSGGGYVVYGEEGDVLERVSRHEAIAAAQYLITQLAGEATDER